MDLKQLAKKLLLEESFRKDFTTFEYAVNKSDKFRNYYKINLSTIHAHELLGKYKDMVSCLSTIKEVVKKYDIYYNFNNLENEVKRFQAELNRRSRLNGNKEVKNKKEYRKEKAKEFRGNRKSKNR